MKVWFFQGNETMPTTMERSKPHGWYFSKYDFAQIDINEFEATLKFDNWVYIASGLETRWKSLYTGIIYKMSTEESMKALSKSIAGVLSGKFNVKQHGGYCTLYYVDGE